MSLKADIETWASALESYEAQDFDEALAKFEKIADCSKILFNIGVINATMGAHEAAVNAYRMATQLDTYLAVAYFQCGVSNFLLGSYEDAHADFDEAYQHLRGNLTIDYEQLGLKFRLYSCEILFNRGLCMIYMGQESRGMVDFGAARTEKQTDEHGVIDEAFGDRGDGYTVFSIPVGVLYKPSAGKLRNLKTKDYLGAPRLVAATDARDVFTGFTGSERRNQERVGPISTGPGDRPPATGANLGRSYTASAAEAQTGGATALRRRPSDNTASVTINRSATTDSLRPPLRQRLQRSNTLATPRGNLASNRINGLGAGAVAGAKGLPTPPDSGREVSERASGEYGGINDVLDDYAGDVEAPDDEDAGEIAFRAQAP